MVIEVLYFFVVLNCMIFFFVSLVEERIRRYGLKVIRINMKMVVFFIVDFFIEDIK